MKVLVTGAGGFLGRSAVRAAAASHEVLALVRPTANTSEFGWPDNVRVLRGDLRQPGQWCGDLADLDAVAHLAAAPSGDLSHQFAGTVVATENLLQDLPMSRLKRFVHVSSFSVYDFASLPGGSLLTETAPIEPCPDARDAYTITKILQERLVVDTCETARTPYVILRPGAIYGPGKTWDYGAAMRLGQFDILFSPLGAFRLTFVDNCADAIVKSLDAAVPSGSIFNIVDDEVPSCRTYHRLCQRAGARTGRAVYVPWFMLSALGRMVGLFNRIAFNGRAKLPELLAHRRQQARWKPLRYTNDRAKTELGWSPRISFPQGVQEIATAEEAGPPARPD